MVGSFSWLLEPSFDLLDVVALMAVEEEQAVWKFWGASGVPTASTTSAVP